MKNMKKLTSILLALVMALGLMTTALAEGNEGEPQTPSENASTAGTITINSAVVGQTYDIYKMFELQSYTDSNYSYKVTSEWQAFFATGAAGASYITLDADGYIADSASLTDSNAAAFAKAALAWAKDHNIAATATAEATAPSVSEGESVPETTTVTFRGLELGYYLIDSSLGALCGLNTTDPNFEMTEKNDKPEVDKKIKNEDGSTSETNTASIGDTITFEATITVQETDDTSDYVLTDTMTDGLTFTGITSVKKGDTDVQYTVNPASGGQSFTLTISKDVIKTMQANDEIIVTYTAVLNENAATGKTNPNTNEIELDYGKSSTVKHKTETYTYEFDLVKTDSDNKLLEGAKFELYSVETGGDKIALVKEAEGVYRVATTDEKTKEDFESAVIEAGKVTIKGLASGTYWLEETEQPAGYNKLTARVEVEIGEDNNSATLNNDAYVKGGVQVINKTGTELPDTGGIGTTIFYAVGGVLVVAAVVLLVTKKRMGAKD